MTNREVFSNYSQGTRTAEVYLTPQGWEVDLHDDWDDWFATRKVHNHSEIYAENLAENWVLGIFDKNDGE